MTFEEWLAELNALAAKDGAVGYAAMTGDECWREAYDDGLTPADAWSEELLAGAA